MDSLLAAFDPPHRKVADAVRATILRAAPGLRETVRMGVPTYSGREPVLYIAEYADHINLGFYRGARLADPDGLLEGTGKSLRHVKMHAVPQARDRRLASLIRSAAAESA